MQLSDNDVHDVVVWGIVHCFNDLDEGDGVYIEKAFRRVENTLNYFVEEGAIRDVFDGVVDVMMDMGNWTKANGKLYKPLMN